VKVADQSVMKMGSRRRAAQLVVEAQELLEDAPLALAEPSLDDRDADGQGDSGTGSVESAV
jgi:hypothetical protein